MGWLGWSEEQVLAADINAIEIGYRGRIKMLQAIFGRDERRPSPRPAPTAAEKPPIVLTPNIFDSVIAPLVTRRKQ